MTEQVNLTGQLKHYFGFDSFKGDQEAIIRNLMSGNDTFVLMPTGGGKSLCYQLPSLIMEGTAIVISPLIALMKNQVDVINGLSESDGVAHYLNSSLNKSAIEKVKNDILNGTTKLLYVAPESLTKEDNVEFLKTVKISFYAIDEAHCISEWGHDFRPEYRRIRPIINEIGVAPVIALTATATDKVRTDIKKNLGIMDAKEFKSSFNRPNLYYEVRPKNKDIDRQIIMFIRQHEGKSGIIYCLSRKKVEELAEVLKANEIKAAPYHAGLDSATRSQTQDDFLMERIDVIVATIAFGMGIDKGNVLWVIHYNMPKSIESFYQEIGRAGRDGAPSDTVLFYSMADIITLRSFCEESGQRDVNMEKLRRMEEYAESRVCRRRILLNYFGETSSCNCGNCDVCKNPPRTFDGTIRAQKALSAVVRSGEHIAVGTCIEILRGMHSSAVVKNKYNEMKTFGVGRDTTSKDWNAYLLQMLQMGFFEIAYNNHNYMKVTDLGWKVLKGEHHVSLAYIEEDDKATRPQKTVRNRKGTIAQPGNLIPEVHAERVIFQEDSKGVEDKGLFEHLRKIRKNLADEQGYPPYIVLSDKSLHELARMKPTTKNAMSLISGIGEFKLNKYGDTFIKAIRKYTGL